MFFSLKGLVSSLLFSTAVFGAAVEHLEKRAQAKGLDVSSRQGNFNWYTVKKAGYSFAYIESTIGNNDKNWHVSTQYATATDAGFIRSGYHVARPDLSSGADQAAFFIRDYGGWSDDGRTLPGALHLEYNPSGAACYGLDAAAMVSWIRDFSDTYNTRVHRYPVIYTTTDWWETCTGNSTEFSNHPLWIADYASSLGPLPGGWSSYTFWQYAKPGRFPGYKDYFNGDEAELKRFALNAS